MTGTAAQGDMFGAQLRALRQQAGLTRGELAERLRVHVSSVSGWEMGKRLPREALRTKLARLLGCDVALLFAPGEMPSRRRCICSTPSATCRNC